MRDEKFDVKYLQLYVYCKVFENNSGAIEIAHIPWLSN